MLACSFSWNDRCDVRFAAGAVIVSVLTEGCVSIASILSQDDIANASFERFRSARLVEVQDDVSYQLEENHLVIYVDIQDEFDAQVPVYAEHAQERICQVLPLAFSPLNRLNSDHLQDHGLLAKLARLQFALQRLDLFSLLLWCILGRHTP